ncbi:hypothetical protein LINPERPRIM_LOCUS37633 [Linum perenne]
MRDSSHHAIYNKFFFRRDILHTVVLDSTSFSRYGLNPAPLIANLGWSVALCDQHTHSVVCPDIVYQFYANLKPVRPLSEWNFSTYVDGHIIFATPLLLAQVLGLPNRVLLPRSLGRDLVTPLDTWILQCATMGLPINYCCLMFATMVNYGIPDYKGSLPFGPQISTLIAKLGIPLRYKFSEAVCVEDLRAQHVLWRVGWSKCLSLPANGSGGEIQYNCSGMDADVINSAESDARAKLTMWCDHSNASDYAESLDYHF